MPVTEAGRLDVATVDGLRQRRPLLWTRTHGDRASAALAAHETGIADAHARLERFRPTLAALFPELQPSDGRIASALLGAERLAPAIGFEPAWGRLLVKADHDLPVGGSIKARGGLYAVLEVAERVASAAGLLGGRDYRSLADDAARRTFARHRIVVGSTGNLGLSVGITAAALGFATTVHMSVEAREWKKERLRDHGVDVVEHTGDYERAVEGGRAATVGDPRSFFIDDENSLVLLYGYATAAEELGDQLTRMGVIVDERHPLFVYLPCGVGGAPSGIALGLRRRFGGSVHCLFAEPVEAPTVLMQLLAPSGSRPSVYDLGLGARTEAEGLAVPRASIPAADIARAVTAGVYTVTDAALLRHVSLAFLQEDLKLEPSAAAGLGGPSMLCATEAGRAYLAASGLADHLARATHVAWTTGGRLVPAAEHAAWVERGRSGAPHRTSLTPRSPPLPRSTSMTIPYHERTVQIQRSLETRERAPLAHFDSRRYIQHNLGLEDGLRPILELMDSLPADRTKVVAHRAFTDGDHSVAHLEYELGDWGPMVGFEVHRWEDDRIVEHWDNLQSTPPAPNPSGRTMTDGASDVVDDGATDANKRLVEAFTESILVAGAFDEIGRFFDGDALAQHNPDLADGVPALVDGLKAARDGEAAGPRYDRLVKVLGWGNLVLAMSEGALVDAQLEPRVAAFYDLYRVADGSITEHWDVVEVIPPQDACKNNNGKF